MQVKDWMNPHVWSVRADDSLDVATRLMWNEDIGALPVVDEWNHPIGMVTDRDIAMSAVMNGTSLSQLRVATCMSRQAFTCQETDSIEAAAAVMRAHQVRRLPVVDDSQRLVGMLSLNDLAHAACGKSADAKAQRVLCDEVVRTLDAVTEPREGKVETEAVIEVAPAARFESEQALAKPAAPAKAGASPAKGGAAPNTSPPPKAAPAKARRRPR